jgi:hypothetical protein
MASLDAVLIIPLSRPGTMNASSESSIVGPQGVLRQSSTMLNFDEGSRGGRPCRTHGLTPTLRGEWGHGSIHSLVRLIINTVIVRVTWLWTRNVLSHSTNPSWLIGKECLTNDVGYHSMGAVDHYPIHCVRLISEAQVNWMSVIADVWVWIVNLIVMWVVDFVATVEASKTSRLRKLIDNS